MNQPPKPILPFGLWPSSISASLISQRLRLEDVQFSADGQTLVWLEGRSGGAVLVAQTGDDARRDLTLEPAPRGGVGYGGAAFSVAGDTVLFSGSDGRVYRRGLGYEPPRPITPAFGPKPAGATAAPVLSPDGHWAVYIYSDGQTDLLALADAQGQDWPARLAHGADFYMSPTWSPQGDRLAWIEWDHPNMPWDGARVQLARVAGSPPRLSEIQTVGGGPDAPVQQPLFSPDGRWLSFLEETGEWADLILLDLQTGARRVLVHGDGFDMAPPAWRQGNHTTAWGTNSQRLYYIRYDGPNATLWWAEPQTGHATQIETAPFTWLSQLAVGPAQESPSGDRLAMLASASTLPDQLVCWDGRRLRPVAYSAPTTYDPAYLPQAREISWPADDGTPVYGLYYAPTNPAAAGDGLPPAIVSIHGGPTSMAFNRFEGEAAYFTSRGYAYVTVNYRGSTGYGRTYRHAMRRRWGDVDTTDTAGCARALAAQGLADPHRLVVMGGSAGGYTVLNVLIHYPGLYKAGVCLYGVTNLFALDLDTHKFEAQYNATMIGPLPSAAAQYHAWSPVFHADQIRDALYIFQGSEDKVVPLNQAEEMVAILRTQGIPFQYKVYEGEGHGFRKSETIADFLKETERFLQQHVLFAP